ncbi:MAG TPA: DUF6049 family protein, partial [Nocardioidaceae bacterium]|nr:DUF6049 family protein [Nocardioidaceae bacterium]
NEEGRVEGADGRARTFIPRMPATAETTSLSLVLPVRGRVLRDEEGRLANPRGWSRRLGPEGRLGRLVDFAQTASATGGQLTLLVDPAVLDAAASIANGNPPLSTGPTDVAGPAGDTEPSASPSEPPPDDADTDEEAAELEPDAQRAADWLAELTEVAEENTTLAVAYADADAASLYRNDYGNLFERATKLSADTMATYGVDAEPVVAPSSGYLPNDTLNRLDSSAPLLLSDRAAPDATNSLVRTRHGHETLLTDSAASSGGPAPGRPYAALAMRQRILAEAAVHSLGDTADQPMVVKLPERWTPDRAWSSASFFTGIDLPWLRTVDVPTARNLVGPFATRGDAYDRPLAYPRAERRAELPTGNLVAAAELNDVGQVFASLLTRNDTVDEQLAEIAMSAVSSQARRRPRPAVNAVRRTSEQVHGALDRIRIEGPPSVTMSSAEGSFQVTVVNDLEEPVTVGIRANTGSPDLVIPDTDPVELGPRQRATVRLSATATNIGVRSVILVPTTVDGKPVGNSTKFSVRSSQVGLVIWIIMGAGAIVLFGAIALRIVRRVRAARGAQRSTPEPVDEGDTT